ncbi:MAG: hypothetical protein AAF990_16695 [Bacteroidota bacterium]
MRDPGTSSTRAVGPPKVAKVTIKATGTGGERSAYNVLQVQLTLEEVPEMGFEYQPALVFGTDENRYVIQSKPQSSGETITYDEEGRLSSIPFTEFQYVDLDFQTSAGEVTMQHVKFIFHEGRR